MQTYICKCGKTFKKSINADSTGYVLKDYSPQHECYGCPFIVIERNWQTKKIVKRECRATPKITYSTRCHIGTADGDHTSCHLYTLDLFFAKRVMNYIKTLEGAANMQENWAYSEPNTIPDEWRAADFGKCYAFKNCFGLAILPLRFQNNKKGTEARRAVMGHFFTSDGRRKDILSEEAEKKIVLERIAIAKDNAKAKQKQFHENSICESCIKKDECIPKITDKCIAYESFLDDKQEEKKMTAAFDLGSMLNGSSGIAAENKVQQIPCDILVPYHNHKFELYSGERLDDMVSSIRENGVLIPIIVQPISGGKYEILIGHNRWNASKLAGNPTVPGIVKEGLSEEEAEMYVIESNLMQRGFDDLKISEQAAVVSMRHRQMFSQGKRNDIIRELAQLENPYATDGDTLSPVDTKSDTNKEIGEEYGMSRASVARLIRIDKLNDEIKTYIDCGTFSVRAGVEISYTDEDTQSSVAELLGDYKIDIKSAQKIRAYAEENGSMSKNDLIVMLTDPLSTAPKPKSVKIGVETYTKYFGDSSYKADEITSIIENALEMYFSQKEVDII